MELLKWIGVSILHEGFLAGETGVVTKGFALCQNLGNRVSKNLWGQIKINKPRPGNLDFGDFN